MPKRPAPVRKPRPDFPLFPHQRGYWAKKIRQRLVYFGKTIGDPKGEKALALWLEQRDELLAGRTPRKAATGLTVSDLCNKFLTTKQHLLDSGELSPCTFGDLHAICKRIGEQFGFYRLVDDLAADDFSRLRKHLAKTAGPVRLGVEIQKVRTVFKFAYDSNLIASPVRFGPTFKKPSLKTMRLSRAEKGPKLFTAAEVRAILAAAPLPLRAMTLLGLNCGYGNSDCASLPTSAVDLKAGWVTFPRPKTGVTRRCPLWPETVSALREVLATRPKPKNATYAKLLFLTGWGTKWAYSKATTGGDGQTKVSGDDLIGKAFRTLLRSLKLYRAGRTFYTLRHCFETVAGDSLDQVATDAIMGHAPRSSDMAAVYREKISDERLKVVTEHVHDWLFGQSEKNSGLPS